MKKITDGNMKSTEITHEIRYENKNNNALGGFVKPLII